MTNNKIDMNDVLGMMFGEPVSAGRIVTGFNGLILGLETNDRKLKDNTVYDIKYSLATGYILEEVGKSHIDWNESRVDIGTMLITESTHLILTEKEKDQVLRMRQKEIEKREK